MGFMTRFRDGLANIVSGHGTSADRRTHASYVLRPLDRAQIDAMYRSSWLMRKVVDLPPYDMTRAGRDWQAAKPVIERLEAEEKRLHLWPKLRQALILGRLGGGAIVIGTGDDPSQPLNPATLRAGQLAYLHVLSRWHLTLGQMVSDPADPMFGQPSSYKLRTAQQASIHPSRVVPFRGLPIPDVGLSWGSEDWFWGDSVLQSVQDAVKNADLAQGGFASLIDEAKVDIYKIPGLTALAGTPEYEDALSRRMNTSQLFKSQFNALLLDAGTGGPNGGGEEWDQRQVTWNGMPEVIRTYLSIVAGASDIPATRLLGKAPDGMNATGEGDETNYLMMIQARQESDLRPALDVLDPLIAASAGVPPGEAWSVFAPLHQLSEKDAAAVHKLKAETVLIYANAGLVPSEAMERAVQNLLVEDSWLPGLDQALDAIPEDERFPSRAEADDDDPSAIVPTEEGGDQLSPTAAGGEGSIARRRAANDSREAVAGDFGL